MIVLNITTYVLSLAAMFAAGFLTKTFWKRKR